MVEAAAVKEALLGAAPPPLASGPAASDSRAQSKSSRLARILAAARSLSAAAAESAPNSMSSVVAAAIADETRSGGGEAEAEGGGGCCCCCCCGASSAASRSPAAAESPLLTAFPFPAPPAFPPAKLNLFLGDRPRKEVPPRPGECRGGRPRRELGGVAAGDGDGNGDGHAEGGAAAAAAAATAPPLLLRGRRGIAADAADAVAVAASEVSGPSSPGRTSLDGEAAAFLPPARREDERAPKNEAAAEARRGVALARGAAAEVGSMDSSCDEVRALLCESFFVLFCVGVGSIVISLSVSDSKGTREGPGGAEERGRFLLMGGATRSVACRAFASLRKKNIVE